MLRDIDAKELGKLFTAGMEKNASREEFAKALGGAIRMGELFAEKKRLSPGETFTLDYIPAAAPPFRSMASSIAGGPIREPEFFSALLKIWLGRPGRPFAERGHAGREDSRHRRQRTERSRRPLQRCRLTVIPAKPTPAHPHGRKAWAFFLERLGLAGGTG